MPVSWSGHPRPHEAMARRLLQMGERLAQLRTRQDVLLPVLPAQEILP